MHKSKYNTQQKLNYLKWLQQMGVSYFCNTKNNNLFTLKLPQKKDNFKKHIMKTNIIAQKKEQKLVETQKQTAPITESVQDIDYAINNRRGDVDIMQHARDLANKASTLSELFHIVQNFEGCKLKNFAKNTVFSDGVANADILFIGEAPGANEDESAVPFCGRSGNLLDRMFKVINVSRETNAYITNTVFWRPPANRRPTSEEIEICRPFLEKHISLINPKLIILVGHTAATALLRTKKTMAIIREHNELYTNQYLTNSIRTIPIFHPAYLLRQPSRKKEMWYDLLKIQSFL